MPLQNTSPTTVSTTPIASMEMTVVDMADFMSVYRRRPMRLAITTAAPLAQPCATATYMSVTG